MRLRFELSPGRPLLIYIISPRGYASHFSGGGIRFGGRALVGWMDFVRVIRTAWGPSIHSRKRMMPNRPSVCWITLTYSDPDERLADPVCGKAPADGQCSRMYCEREFQDKLQCTTIPFKIAVLRAACANRTSFGSALVVC